MSEYQVHVDAFCRKIRWLVGAMVRRIPNDPIIYRVQKRVAMACDTLPCTVVEMVGYYLYQYKDHIYAGNDQFFVENSYDQDVRAALAQKSSDKAKDRVDLMKAVMPKCKEAWVLLDEAERASYRQASVDLLDSYLEYMCLCPTAGRACDNFD